jgi:hypothetical protein
MYDFSASLLSVLADGLLEVYHGEANKMATTISLQFIGADSDGSDVRFSELITQLEAVKAALKETELCTQGEFRQPLDYRVVDLKHSSPATLVLEPIIENRSAAYADRVLKGFTTELRRIRVQKRLIAEPEMARLEAYRGIGHRPKSHIREVRIALHEKATPTREARIDERFKDNLKEILGPDILANGSVTGRLEYLNLHNVRKFRLYPNVGPKRINGTFREDKRAAIRNGMDQYVTVFGRLKYKTWGDYPYEVQAEDIRVHEPEEDLPTFNDLKGIAPRMTGDLNSVEWVRRIRDEEW